jgi:hypothetical protein
LFFVSHIETHLSFVAFFVETGGTFGRTVFHEILVGLGTPEFTDGGVEVEGVEVE